jgi:hypothetical protein
MFVFGSSTNIAVAASTLFDDLTTLRSTNPTWWAANKCKYYASLLSYYKTITDGLKSQSPSSKLVQRIGTCSYELALYPEWERTQGERGVKTARSIEKALKWDGVTGEGQENELVTAYVKSHPK